MKKLGSENNNLKWFVAVFLYVDTHCFSNANIKKLFGVAHGINHALTLYRVIYLNMKTFLIRVISIDYRKLCIKLLQGLSHLTMNVFKVIWQFQRQLILSLKCF